MTFSFSSTEDDEEDEKEEDEEEEEAPGRDCGGYKYCKDSVEELLDTSHIHLQNA